jgi:hypothetical protein
VQYSIPLVYDAAGFAIPKNLPTFGFLSHAD